MLILIHLIFIVVISRRLNWMWSERAAVQGTAAVLMWRWIAGSDCKAKRISSPCDQRTCQV